MTTSKTDGWIAKIKPELHNARTLRATLVDLAYVAQENPSHSVLGILTSSRVGEAQIDAELRLFRSILATELANRIHLVKQTGQGRFSAVPCGLSPALISGMLRDGRSCGPEPAKRHRATRHDVLPVLLLNWLAGNTPMTTRHICDATGVSYPTVTSVLQALRADGVLRPDSGARVALNRFAAGHWKQWVSVRAETRTVHRFADRSQPLRPATDLLGRLQQLGLTDVAVSGALGAQCNFPELDLFENNRLDLIAHGAATSDMGFIQEIDACLERVHDADAPAHIVVRTLSRTNSYFESCGNGTWRADPFECMADMYEARLDTQADRMLNTILAARREPAFETP